MVNKGRGKINCATMMSDEKQVSIEIDGAGIKFKSKISPTMAGNILKICLTESNTPQTSTSVLTESPVVEKKMSLGEFVHKYEPTTYPEKILAIATYLKDFREKENFSPEDINPLFRQMGDIPPRNFSRDFRVTIINSWIAANHDDPNTYYVTDLGLKALSSSFSGDSIKKTRIKRRKKGIETPN